MNTDALPRVGHTITGPEITGSRGSNFSRGTVCVRVDGVPTIMTVRGWNLLCAMAGNGGAVYVRGAMIATARTLVDNGLATLFGDGSRRAASLTLLGELVASVRTVK